ncbi:MAG: post-PEP-CTERM-1 domain-containing protein [Pyrinomonadaceae bacterium]
MKKSKRVSHRRPAAGRGRAFRAGLFACALLVAGVATAAATYASRSLKPSPAGRVVSARPVADPYVTVEVGGQRLRVNPQTLQQAPLTQDEARQLAAQLEGNKATDGLVEERHEDGTVSVDLQGRFQNVTLAKKNDDGTVSAACVDTPEAAGEFLRSQTQTTITGTGVNRKAASSK